MRLLIYSEGELSWTKDLVGDDEIPPYAILSHTWSEDSEVIFEDLMKHQWKSKDGYKKILFCAQQAERDGLRYFWVDTCCINKESSAELSEAINSMFQWYRRAARCYVYLSDVSDTSSTSTGVAFEESRWFTRGWTLQELLAPTSVQFFSREGTLLGDKTSLIQEIVETTGIAIEALQGAPLANFTIDERMKWANGRRTKREEDEAYSLLGLFDLHMPLIYGEGRRQAFKRLQKELKESLVDSTELRKVENVHWMVPRTINSLFTGRSELIDQIKDAFRIDNIHENTEQKRLVITGMGGQGKSEICLKVAGLMQNHFWGVFWIDVGSHSTAKNGFTGIARALNNPGTTIDQCLQALASTGERWLLILDNCDDPEFDYAAYIPSGNRGAVIMTSRVPQCSRYSTVKSIELNGLDMEHSMQLLLKAAHVPETSWVSHEEQTQAIVRLLGSHTLALVQAGAYIAEGYCRLDQYPERYRRQRKRLLKYNLKQEQSRYRDVYATFEASANELEHTKGEIGRDALDLLATFSMLHFSVLPLHIFNDAWKSARSVFKDAQMVKLDRPWQWHLSRLPGFVGVREEEWDDYRLKSAIALLASLSLVKRHTLDDVESLSMHPLAHAWAKDRLENDQQREALLSTACIFSFSRSETWSLYEKDLRPHILTFLSADVDVIFSLAPQNEMLAIILRCGWILTTIREDARLELLLQSIYQRLQISPSKPSAEHLPIWKLAGKNTGNMGYLGQSVTLLGCVTNVLKTTLADTHPDVLDAEHYLAAAYTANDQTNAAIPLLEHIVAIRAATLDETDQDLRRAQHDLAFAYTNSNRSSEAVTILEQVVKAESILLPKTHMKLLGSQHELARAYQAHGQTKKSVALLEYVISVKKTTMPETHPSLLISQDVLSFVYWVNEQMDMAIKLLEHVVRVRKTTFAATHPERQNAESMLSRMLRIRDERMDFARTLLEAGDEGDAARAEMETETGRRSKRRVSP